MITSLNSILRSIFIENVAIDVKPSFTHQHQRQIGVSRNLGN